MQVYEREPHIGGILRQIYNPTLDLSDPEEHNWFASRCRIVRYDFPSMFVPRVSYEEMCHELLDHDLIHLRVNAPVSYPETLAHQYERTYFTGDIDRLFAYRYGHLPTDALIPIHGDAVKTMMQQYQILAEHYGLILFGMRACHETAWMHQLLSAAVALLHS